MFVKDAGLIRLARFVLIGTLGGCSAYSSSLPAAPAQPALLNPEAPAHAAAPATWVYTTSTNADDATVYARTALSLTQTRTLSRRISSPAGSVATPNGFWYVANGGDSNVLVYRTRAKGPRGPVATLGDAGQRPIDVAVTSDRQLVAVSNAETTGSGSGSVSVYVDGATEPTRTLSYGTDTIGGMGIAIDGRGNCYWSFNDFTSGVASIVMFAHCAGTGTVVVPSMTRAAGLAFNPRGDLFYIDAASIYKCRHTAGCTLFSTGYSRPAMMNFDASGRHIWVADEAGQIDAVSPSTGGIELEVLTGGPANGPFGIAPVPGE